MTHTIDPDITTADLLASDEPLRQVVVEKHVHTQVQEPKSSVPAFITGFLTAGLLAAVAAIVFLAVSDRDDDGNVNLDVPTVDLEVDG